jgi:tetratricopeptide (TPR) repeat protein
MKQTTNRGGRAFWLAILLAATASLAPAQSPTDAQEDGAARATRREKGDAALVAALDEAIASNDVDAIAKAHEPLAKAEAERKNDYALKIATARGYLARADLLRVERHVGKVDSETNAAYRTKQAEWGEKGANVALEAVELAKDDAERSEAHRLAGECSVHRINGPIAGLRIGPVAKAQIEEALRLDPGNREAIRAQGLMFLHNPPINGGDLERAVETFKKVSEMKDGDWPRALLAQAWLKRGRPERARLEANRALAINPKNRLAQLIVVRVDELEAAK